MVAGGGSGHAESEYETVPQWGTSSSDRIVL